MKAIEYAKILAIVLLYVSFAGVASTRAGCPKDTLKKAVEKAQAAKDALDGASEIKEFCEDKKAQLDDAVNNYTGTEQELGQQLASAEDAMRNFCLCCNARGGTNWDCD